LGVSAVAAHPGTVATNLLGRQLDRREEETAADFGPEG
jgi:hypothetical protein